MRNERMKLVKCSSRSARWCNAYDIGLMKSKSRWYWHHRHVMSLGNLFTPMCPWASAGMGKRGHLPPLPEML